MKSNINHIFLLIILSLFPFSSFGLERLAEADSAYNRKEYQKAITLYRTVLEEKGYNAPMLFNMGNAHYELGDYGRAMVCYLRARKLDPSIKELNSNLKYLRSRVEDANKAEQRGKRLKVTPDEQGFFQSLYRAIAQDTSSDVWAWWGAGFFILFVGCVALYIFTRNVMVRKIGFFGGFLSLGVSFLLVLFAILGARSQSNNEEGVLLAFKAVLQTEPTAKDGEAHGPVLTRGTVVRIVSEESNAEGMVTWYKIRLNSDYIGWVRAEDVEII